MLPSLCIAWPSSESSRQRLTVSFRGNDTAPAVRLSPPTSITLRPEAGNWMLAPEPFRRLETSAEAPLGNWFWRANIPRENKSEHFLYWGHRTWHSDISFIFYWPSHNKDWDWGGSRGNSGNVTHFWGLNVKTNITAAIVKFPGGKLLSHINMVLCLNFG